MNLKEYFQQHREAFDDDRMSDNADLSFQAKLQTSLHTPKKSKVITLRHLSIAASIAIVFFIGFWLQKQSFDSEKQLLLASLTNDSVGVRLEGVYKFDETYSKEDKKIIDTLIKILYDDKNANVKIATIDALLKFPSNEKIRKSLILAIEKEKTPLVQIKLIKSLSFLREHRAQKPLENIINDEQTFPIVKSNAALAMETLKQ
ncbi:MAG: HEAT repeat domain-containing protein [Flavobacteriaceae bacterium]